MAQHKHLSRKEIPIYGVCALILMLCAGLNSHFEFASDDVFLTEALIGLAVGKQQMQESQQKRL